MKGFAKISVALRRYAFGIALFGVSATAAMSWAQQPELQITTPPDGTIVNPGQTINVIATPASKSTFSEVVIIGQEPIGFSDSRKTPPFQFGITIPPNITPGTYTLTASGIIKPGVGAESDPIAIVVERPDSAGNLTADPSRITFHAIGERVPITLSGVFSDGSTIDISRSSKTTYVTADAAVAKVDANGLVVAIGRGSTEITVHYGTLLVIVPVAVVTGPTVVTAASPGTLWPPNGKLVTVNVSGTVADSGGGLRSNSARFMVRDTYGLIQPTGKIALTSDGSYAFSVSLEASRRGDNKTGRQYTIVVSARDTSGHLGSASAVIVVPHDQGR